MLKLSILMPVRNEGINMKIMLKILKAVVDVPHEVLVVYDFPEEDSIPAVKAMQPYYPYLKLVHNKMGKGVVNAIRSGVSAASGEYILLFAVDEAGPVLAVDDMIALMDQGCGMVSCTRYAYGGRRLGGSFIEGALSRFGNALFGVLSGATFSDGTTGIKMFRKELFENISVESKAVGWAVVFELAIKAQLAGEQIGEVPVVSIDRLYGGRSTFSLGPWLKEYLRWFIRGVFELRRSSVKPRKTLVAVPQNLAR